MARRTVHELLGEFERTGVVRFGFQRRQARRTLLIGLALFVGSLAIGFGVGWRDLPDWLVTGLRALLIAGFTWLSVGIGIAWRSRRWFVARSEGLALPHGITVPWDKVYGTERLQGGHRVMLIDGAFMQERLRRLNRTRQRTYRMMRGNFWSGGVYALPIYAVEDDVDTLGMFVDHVSQGRRPATGFDWAR